jgi:hypothetical protein
MGWRRIQTLSAGYGAHRDRTLGPGMPLAGSELASGARGLTPSCPREQMASHTALHNVPGRTIVASVFKQQNDRSVI